MVDDPDEIFEVVDESDRVVGTERRSVVHARGLRHRSVHILVVNSAGDVLAQLRGASKDEYPLAWDVSVGGHLAPGETYEQAAHRELEEELGLQGETLFLRKTAAAKQTGWEFTCLYLLTTDEAVRPDPDEIERCEFVEPARLLTEIESGERRATPALHSAIVFYLDRERSDLEI